MATTTKRKRPPAKYRDATAKAKALKAKAKADAQLVKLPNRRQIRNMTAKRKFIEALASFGTIKKACAEAGVSRTTYYLWTDPKIAEHYGLDPEKHYDPEFHRASIDAYHGRFQERVLQTGYDRALDGWTDYHYDRNGNLIKEEDKYDSSILQMLMKRADPALKDKSGDVNVGVGVTQNNVNVHEQSAAALDSLTPQQKKLLLQAASLNVPSDEGNGAQPKTIEGKVVPQETIDAN